MQRWACRISALAVTMLFASCISRLQDFAAREKLRAESVEFRKKVIRVTDGVYVAVALNGEGPLDPAAPESADQHAADRTLGRR
jgi:hypothetical protein